MGISSNNDVTLNLPVSSKVNKFSVGVSNASVQIMNSNDNRIGFTIFNPLNQMVYVDFIAGVTPTDYSFIMLPNSFYECPVRYTGKVFALASELPGGSLLIREFVA